jgi:hypothetical protein
MGGSVGFLDHFSALEEPGQSWRVVYSLPEAPLDGETSRRAHVRRERRQPAADGIGLGEPPAPGPWVGSGGGEVERNQGAPLLLQRLELKGAPVTIGAIGAQIDIAATVLERGGDYLFALKGNRPELHAEAEARCADPANAVPHGSPSRIAPARERITDCNSARWAGDRGRDPPLRIAPVPRPSAC